MRKPLKHHLFDYFFPHERNGHHPYLFRAVSVFALLLVVLAAEAAYLAATMLLFPRTNFLGAVLPSALVTLTNADRSAVGARAVDEDPLLDAAAAAAARDMAEKGYFAHVAPDGTDPWHWLDQVGYRYSYAGQNLAIHFSDSTEVERAWMASPTHRENIVKREYTRVGFGTAVGQYEGHETVFVVEYFATPAPRDALADVFRGAETGAGRRADSARLPAPVSNVLGTQVSESYPQPVVRSAAVFLTSPMHLLTIFLIILFAAIGTFFIIALLLRGRCHPRLLATGLFLLAGIGALLCYNYLFRGAVQLPTEPAPSAEILRA